MSLVLQRPEEMELATLRKNTYFLKIPTLVQLCHKDLINSSITELSAIFTVEPEVVPVPWVLESAALVR